MKAARMLLVGVPGLLCVGSFTILMTVIVLPIHFLGLLIQGRDRWRETRRRVRMVIARKGKE
jgi:hypothetical protein